MTEEKPPVAITIVNGFLGAGKTTVILNVIKEVSRRYNLDTRAEENGKAEESAGTSADLSQSSFELPKRKYNIVWLKNEFGLNEVDSILGNESSISSVKEILNGCLCCTLVGRLGDAIEEILETVQCDRIMIETSGSAYPAPLVQEVNRMMSGSEGSRKLPVRLDGVLCVVDAVNFEGYSDKSHTARMQAKYTDLILLNKHELATRDQIERVQDEILDINPETPIVRTDKGHISPDVVFGLDSKLLTAIYPSEDLEKNDHPSTPMDEYALQTSATKATSSNAAGDVDVVHIEWFDKKDSQDTHSALTLDILSNFLSFIDQSTCIRCKGVILIDTQSILQSTNPTFEELRESLREQIKDLESEAIPKQVLVLVNWAFGRGMYISLTHVPYLSKVPSSILNNIYETAAKKYSASKDLLHRHTDACHKDCIAHTTDNTENHLPEAVQNATFSRLTTMGMGVATHYFRSNVAKTLERVVPYPLKSSIEEILLHDKGVVCSVVETQHQH